MVGRLSVDRGLHEVDVEVGPQTYLSAFTYIAMCQYRIKMATVWESEHLG